MLSDAYKMIDVDDVVYEVDAAMIVVKEGEVDIGANASAEEQAEALEDGAQQVNNIVHSAAALARRSPDPARLPLVVHQLRQEELPDVPECVTAPSRLR